MVDSTSLATVPTGSGASFCPAHSIVVTCQPVHCKVPLGVRKVEVRHYSTGPISDAIKDAARRMKNGEITIRQATDEAI